MDDIRHGPPQEGQGTTAYHSLARVEVGFYLVLNPMTSNTQSQQGFGPWPSKQALRDWYNTQLAEESYTDEGPDMFNHGQTKKYRKVFKKGSALEWMNPLGLGLTPPGLELRTEDWGQLESHGHGVHEMIVGMSEVDPKTRVQVWS